MFNDAVLSPYPPQWFGPMLVTEFQEIELGYCYRSGLFVQSCKMLFRHWFSLYLFVLQANYQYILNDTKTNAQPMLST